MSIATKNKIVSILDDCEFKVEKIELRGNYWWIGHRINGVGSLINFVVKDNGYSLSELMWQFLGFKNARKAS